MKNLTVYLLKSANPRSVDRHLRYPGKLRRARPWPRAPRGVLHLAADCRHARGGGLEAMLAFAPELAAGAYTSSTSQLNLSRFGHTSTCAPV